MIRKQRVGGLRVILRQRVIVDDDLVFNAKREVNLPIEPFVGLVLVNTLWRPGLGDPSEYPIDSIDYDLATGEITCYLPNDDYRYESSGYDDWTENDVRKRFRDWALERVPLRKPRLSRTETRRRGRA